MNHAVFFEEHRKAGIVPTGDGWLADRRMALGGLAELLLYGLHGRTPVRALHGGVAKLHLVVDDERFGDCGTGRGQQADEQTRLRVFMIELLIKRRRL